MRGRQRQKERGCNVAIELQLIEKTGQTRIKISTAEWNKDSWIRKAFEGIKPEKESSRYIYFVVNADLLNNRKRS